ncbi:MAG: hypothetical protein HY652_08470 [Acidobacteria bacterium]|nr:hypothetical protein [Acidobacteriota bacterium]
MESRGEEMIVARYQQRTIYEAISCGVITDHEELLWEEWMRKADELRLD